MLERIDPKRADARLCPARAVEWLIAEFPGAPPDAPLVPLRASELVRELRRLVRRCCRHKPSEYSLRSLRIGGATTLMALGAPPEAVRTMGRWASDAFRIYLRDSADGGVAGANGVATAMAGGLERATMV